MLVSVIGTDRNEVEATAHALRNYGWVGVRLACEGTDFATIMLSISIEAARKLVAQLPGVIEEAEQLAQKADEVPSNA